MYKILLGTLTDFAPAKETRKTGVAQASIYRVPGARTLREPRVGED